MTRILPDGRHDDAFGRDPAIDYAEFPSLVVESEPGRLLFSGNVKPLRTLSQPFALTSQGRVITDEIFESPFLSAGRSSRIEPRGQSKPVAIALDPNRRHQRALTHESSIEATSVSK